MRNTLWVLQTLYLLHIELVSSGQTADLRRYHPLTGLRQ